MNKENLSLKEKAVYELIEAGKITQLSISREASFIGAHPKYEFISKQATLRMVRQVIRDLRLNHKAKILSDGRGYWICNDENEAKDYLERLERTAKAQSKSHMVTYNSMRQIFNVQSDYFARQQSLFDVEKSVSK